MFYPIFLLITAAEMIGELLISVHNSKYLMAQGAIEIAPKILPMMSFLYVLMYPACLVEYFFLPKTLPVWWLALFGGIFIFAKALKFWAIATLGKFWTMRVLILPNSKAVNSGPYRLIKHPNYLAVLLEIASTTLLGKSLLTFLIITGTFSVLLFWRIRVEEQALQEHTDYSLAMRSKSRFVP